ncbi:MAG: hypothetical protein ABIE42_00120 [Candidatus Eisenbacteria bacterium]
MKGIANAVSALTLACILCLPGVCMSLDPGVVVMDGDFTDWSHVVLLESGVGAGTVTRNETGGNPAAFFEISTESGWELSMWVLLWKDGVEWDPSDGCEIETIQLEIDEKAINSAGDGQNIKLLVVQDGRYYGAPLVPWLTGSGTEKYWETHVFAPAYVTDFGEVPPHNFDPAERPDFTATGSTIKLGFMVGVSSVLDARVHAYDNWKITIECIPCPVEESTWGNIKALYR